MYRLVGPNLLIYIPIVLIGIFFSAIIPKFLGTARILSSVSLFIGEAGMSFIPVLALYPKARFSQAGMLATICLSTTILLCFASWGLNNLTNASNYAFMWKDGEFYINIYSLLAANIFSSLALILNFRLVYDEELTKKATKKDSQYKGRETSRFMFSKPLLKRPQFEEKRPATSPLKDKQEGRNVFEKSFEEDFGKPFEFEPQIEIDSENLPEESSGKLFSQQEIVTKEKVSDFFDTEEKTPFFERPKKTQASPLPPSNIKEELGAIFEQYSSLDAVKKLTSSKIPKSSYSEKKKEPQIKARKPYELPKDVPRLEVRIEGEVSEPRFQGEDIQEATFRQITEAEKLDEIKEELKKELKQQIEEKTSQIKDEQPKEEIKQEDFIQSIKTLKEELFESLKEEIKKEIVEKEVKKEIVEKEVKKETVEPAKIETQEESIEEENPQEGLEYLEEKLALLNKNPQIVGSMFLNKKGKVVFENWTDKQVLHKDIDKTIIQYFDLVDSQVHKTNQGYLSNILLESENELLVLATIDNNVLTVCSRGTTGSDCGQILREISELEEVNQ